MTTPSFLCSFPSYILIALYFIAVFTPFIFIGLFYTQKIIKAGYGTPKQASLMCFAVISIAGYIAAWCFLTHMIIGNIFVTSFFIYSIYLIAQKQNRMDVKDFIKDFDIFIPLVMILLIGLYYIAISYGDVYTNIIGDKYNQQGVEITDKPGSMDYLIQFKWMKYMVRGKTPWSQVLDPTIGKTTVADRPPLMAGIASLYYSPSLILKPLFTRDCGSNIDIYYFMAITTLLSLMWIPAVWALLRTISFSQKKSMILILCLAHVYFMFFSSVFTWPKSFAGSFIIGVFTLLIAEPIYNNKPASYNSVVLASIFAGLAAFAHFSIVIPCFVIALILFKPSFFPGIRNVLIGSSIFLLLAIPYLALTNFMEGSNKLTRYTMSTPDLKTIPEEYENLSTSQAVTLAYSKISIQEIIANKIYNIQTIFTQPFIPFSFHLENNSDSTPLIRYIFGSINILNFCWLLFIPGLYLLRINFDNRIKLITNYSLLIAFSSLFILAMINFRQPVMNINNIAPTLLIMLALSIRAFSLPKWFYLSITGLNIAYFYDYLWHAHLNDNISLNTIMLPVYLLAVFGTIYLLNSINKSTKRNEIHYTQIG